jgi:hypothetical protein
VTAIPAAEEVDAALCLRHIAGAVGYWVSERAVDLQLGPPMRLHLSHGGGRLGGEGSTWLSYAVFAPSVVFLRSRFRPYAIQYVCNVGLARPVRAI